MSDAEGRAEDARIYAGLSAEELDESARERAEAVEEFMHMAMYRLGGQKALCDECGEMFADSDIPAHLATCELLRARAETECDAAERGK